MMKVTANNTAERLRNEEIYHALFDGRREAIFIANPQGEILRANKAACLLYGYTEEEFMTLGTMGVMSQEDPRLAPAIKHRLETGSFEGELNVVKKNGEILPVEISSTSFELEDGRVHYFTIVKDASERKRAERDMELLLSNTQESFMVIDLDYKIITFNHQFTRRYKELTGREVKKGESILNHALPAQEEVLLSIFKDVLNGNNHEHEIQVFNAAGQAQYLSVNYKPAYEKSGDLIGIFITSTDITQRRLASEKILLDKERYDLAAKATNDAIYDWDISNNRLYWGEGLNTLFGYDADSDLHTIEGWIQHIHPDDLYGTVYSMRNAVYSSQDLQWESEYSFLRADGNYSAILDRGFIIRNESGKPLRMIGAMQDITLRKQNEVTLKQLNDQLKKRARELAASNEELEQFAYIASHDLQEPLRMVTSFLTQLEKKYRDSLDEKAQKYIWFAVDGAVRMRQIIFDLLEYSRMGRADYVLENVDTTRLLNGVIEMHSTLISENNAQIILGNLPEIKASKVPIEHVFDNLISNAIKYHKQGTDPVITINAEEQNNCWQFSVEDNGIGIRPEFFHKIFVIFQRLHNKEEYSGTGIGLAICKKIVENHKGRIWVESEPGRGSTFYFTICK